MDPNFQDHENPALEALFDEAVPRVVEILAKFHESHPVMAHFNKHFKGKQSFERSRGASEWMCTFGLVPTPELEAVLQPPLHSALVHAGLSKLHEPQRNQRVLEIGSALLQLLAIQQQFGEPVNLNGDLLSDLLDGCIVQCTSDGNEGLVAMFTAIPLPNRVLKTHALAKRMLKFNTRTIYEPDYQPPTIRRDEPSRTGPPQLFR
ncbi:hypothetical protein DFH09DRAFT_1085851 [Mycena vulgaris]|nr:hypothetical protein DFH09DRAFT_1085851 [Mycena vulgaris]